MKTLDALIIAAAFATSAQARDLTPYEKIEPNRTQITHTETQRRQQNKDIIGYGILATIGLSVYGYILMHDSSRFQKRTYTP